MDYIVKNEDFATRYNEYSGEKIIISVQEIDHSDYAHEYIIYTRREGSKDPETVLLKLWEDEAIKLREILK